MKLSIPEHLLDARVLKDCKENEQFSTLMSRYYSLVDLKCVDNQSVILIQWLVNQKLLSPRKVKKNRFKIESPLKKISSIFDNIHLEKIETKSPPSLDPSINYYQKLHDTRDNKEISLLLRKYLGVLKNNPRRKKLGFSLTVTDLRKIYLRKTCYYTGIKFNSKDILLSPTLDRIDSTKGYVRGNVVLCTNWANQFKSLILEGNHSLKTDSNRLSIFLKNYQKAMEKNNG